MSTIVRSGLGARLCEALGLDPMKVTRIELDFPCNDIATATATLLPDPDEVDAVTHVVKQFELRPLGDES